MHEIKIPQQDFALKMHEGGWAYLRDTLVIKQILHFYCGG